MREPIYYIAGEYVPKSQAKIPANNLGFTRAYSAYEGLRSYNHVIFRQKDHIDRLKFSLENLLIEYPDVSIESILQTLVEKNDHLSDLVLKIYVSGGPEENDFISEVFIVAEPLPTFPEEYFTSGINVLTSPMGRVMTAIKSTQYTNAMILLKQAQAKDSQDVLYVDKNNNLLELTRSNFFGIRENTLFTPKSDILAGITRKVVLEIATELEMNVEIAPLPYSMLEHFDEAFLTSSFREVMPIKKVDNILIKGGEKVSILQKAFKKYVAQYIEDKTLQTT